MYLLAKNYVYKRTISQLVDGEYGSSSQFCIFPEWMICALSHLRQFEFCYSAIE